MVKVTFTVCGVHISKAVKLEHMPLVGDDVFVGLQRGIVSRRWWNLSGEHLSLMVRICNLDGSEWEDDKENWAMLLEVFSVDEWTWTGSFPENLTAVWPATTGA